MRHIKIQATNADVALANAIARHTTPALERRAQAMTWLADEKLMLLGTMAFWLFSRTRAPERREQADHLLLAVYVSSIVPHILKRVIDQQRPDRRIRPPRHGIPESGRELDAFPSGHAVHVGAVASAVTWIEPKAAPWVWLAGAGLAGTRVVLLAHWASDVVVGLGAGVLLERLLRPVSHRLFGKRTHQDEPLIGDSPADSSLPDVARCSDSPLLQ